MNEEHTLYSIKLKINKESEIQVGKLGSFVFPKGYYIYIGSAKKNIKSRVNRHIKIDKKKKWHFDFLRPYGEIVEIETYDNSLTECELFEKIKRETNGEVLVKKFGSTDCKCFTHLIYIA